MFIKLNNRKYNRPLNDNSSNELIKELLWFKDDLMTKTQLRFWILDVTYLVYEKFNNNDKQYKIILSLQQEIIDETLIKCIDIISILLVDHVYMSVKESEIDTFILSAIINKKSRKFNLQLLQLFRYDVFCHRNLVERKQAIEILKQG